MTSRLLRFPRRWALACWIPAALLVTACETAPVRSTGPTLMEQYKPRSILILPPIDNTIEVNATYGYLPTVSRPVAERGFYVFPVAVVDRLMRENGLPGPAEMHSVSRNKLREIFGADAVLYLSLENWGTGYSVLDSSTKVTVSARLVDLRSGVELWKGKRTAVDSSSASNQAGLIGLLVGAVVNQIASSVRDISPQVASRANVLLFGAEMGSGSRAGNLPVGPYRVAAENAAVGQKTVRSEPRPESPGAQRKSVK